MVHINENIAGRGGTTVWSLLWQDERGIVISIELILITTIVVIGLVVGLATFRDSIVNELGDGAIAVSALNQSYSMATDLDAGMGGQQTTRTFTFGEAQSGDPFVSVEVEVFDSNYSDMNDFCDHITAGEEGSSVADEAGQAPACIVHAGSNQEGDPLP